MSDEDFLLSPDSLLKYFVTRGLAKPGERVTARELGGGVSNIVLLIEWPGQLDRRWVAKQSLGKLRVKDDWRSDRGRVFREAEAIQALRPMLRDSVPEVVHVDRENFLFIMTAAPARSTVWKDSLLAGHVDLAVAQEAGRLLASLIKAAPAGSALHRTFEDRTVFDQLRIDPYYRTSATRNPDVAGELGKLIGQSWQIQTALVHGDYSPKNMLVPCPPEEAPNLSSAHDLLCGKGVPPVELGHGQEPVRSEAKDGHTMLVDFGRFRKATSQPGTGLVRRERILLIDFEVVHWGDPAFDSGFFLNHLLLKALHQPWFGQRYIEAARQFWKEVTSELGPAASGDFEYMTVRHLGALMLARIDGKSPVEYIRDESTKERVRRVAKCILLERYERLEGAFEVVLAEFAGRR
jgi:aminoglycoside phosphotransferase (APT) family kinase protein